MYVVSHATNPGETQGLFLDGKPNLVIYPNLSEAEEESSRHPNTAPTTACYKDIILACASIGWGIVMVVEGEFYKIEHILATPEEYHLVRQAGLDHIVKQINRIPGVH